MGKFKIGDKVIVAESGRIYSTFSSKFKEMGFKNVSENDSEPLNKVFTVFALSEKESEYVRERL